MIDDDVTAILTKTRDYYNFIKGRLGKESILLKTEDLDMLNTIDSYLTIVSEDTSKRRGIKSDVHKNILGTCISYLQRLDRITKDYKLFQNGSNSSK
ncbi:MAG: hypothetical protein HYR67_04430 [Bacteroidetes bacterium]|nr:hypothetical protein [Bacteroidota bacterium]